MPNDEHSKGGRGPRTTEALRRLIQRTTLTFAIPPNEEQLFPPLTEAIARVGKPFNEIGTALRANVAGLLSTVSVPYTLAYRSATDSHWQRIYSTAPIRSLKLVAGPNETEKELELRREREALTRAKSEMAGYVPSPEGKDALMWDTLGFLENLCSDEPVIGAANDLILQGAVLCWGAFEVFARDCFLAHLNASLTALWFFLQTQLRNAVLSCRRFR